MSSGRGTLQLKLQERVEETRGDGDVDDDGQHEQEAMAAKEERQSSYICRESIASK